MSMHALRGLELVCITRESAFDLEYSGGGKYAGPTGEVIDDLMDMGCVGCGANYYTRESSAIDFCPACGFMERKRFKDFQDLQKWSNGQSWKFLKRTGMTAFGVLRSGDWRLTFGKDAMALEMTGQFTEIHPLVRT
jgi:ribosomal protein L37E